MIGWFASGGVVGGSEKLLARGKVVIATCVRVVGIFGKRVD